MPFVQVSAKHAPRPISRSGSRASPPPGLHADVAREAPETALQRPGERRMISGQLHALMSLHTRSIDRRSSCRPFFTEEAAHIFSSSHVPHEHQPS